MSIDAGEEADRLDGFAHPREAAQLVGHGEAQLAFLDGVASGRLHHAWLIGGPEGIGKATFAYQVAKFLLAQRPGTVLPASGAIVVDPAAQATRLVAGLAHPDLVVLRRQPATDKKGPSTQIPVDSVRRALEMFGSTASGGGWRVCIVDSAEDLNTAGANALLKMVEEPPPRAIFLIIAHQPGRVLPTIRSRCRKLLLHPLEQGQIRQVLQGMALSNSAQEIDTAISLADGSVRRALSRLNAETAALILSTRDLLGRLPEFDLRAVLALADQLTGRAGEAGFAIFIEAVQDWASMSLRERSSEGALRLAPLAEVWDKIARDVKETDALNLDRKPLVLSIFQDLADAVMRMRRG